MSWEMHDQDEGRSDLGRPGGDWQGMRPAFDNPFTWAITLGRMGGISIRMHVLFLAYITVMLIRAALPPSATATQTPIKPVQMVIAMASLVIIVLAHELGHCLACRWMKGEADEILMWPLGGLAFCRPGPRWHAHLVTALGGPLVNLIICAVTGVILGLLTGKWMGLAIPNPLTMDGLVAVELASYSLQALYLINYISFVLLLFNLLPIFPLDGGRVAQSLMWRRYGYTRSMVYAVRIGFVGATLLFIFGAVAGEWMVIGIALFGAFTCYTTQKQLQWSEAALGADISEADEYALTVHDQKEDVEAAKPTWTQKRAERAALREQQEAEEVDRILGKIAQSGIDSLTRSERSLLERATQRKRQQR